jgi:hypothetical protein
MADKIIDKKKDNTKRQAMVFFKILHRKLKIEQVDPTEN